MPRQLRFGPAVDSKLDSATSTIAALRERGMSACEIPPMQVVHLESESPTTLGGFRGMGEGGTIGAPAAIANAVTDALAPLGIDINELPVTPERLFRLIKAARALGKQ